ncbi:MAG: VWA domain-containing protein [Halobacteria archaeon]|nr:VWA domain-containing protein [Halobacteria archaeon]
MDNTSIEAYPDLDDDGIQELNTELEACTDYAQTPQDLDPRGDGVGSGLRTLNEDTVTENDDGVTEIKPVINLEDVKPGDFGELTLSFHLCDNPGHIWLTGNLDEALENGLMEPERKDTDEEEGVVELLDEVQTCMWYDEDGDNMFEPGGITEPVDVLLVTDRSGSMEGDKMDELKTAAKSLVDALELGPDARQVGLVSFSDEESLDQSLSTDATAIENSIDSLTPGGQTNMEGGVHGGHEELLNKDMSADVVASGNDRDEAKKIMVFLTDGSANRSDDPVGSEAEVDDQYDPTQEATTAKEDGIDMYTVGFGIDPGSAVADRLIEMASDPSQAYIGDVGELEQIFNQISQIIGGEECFWEGSLRQLLNLLQGLDTNGNDPNGEEQNPPGIPLDGDRITPYEEIVPTPEEDAQMPNVGNLEERECFIDGTTNAVGLAWWVPIDHGNEIQTDSVQFDIGVYTEQCRHNDGTGMEIPGSAGNVPQPDNTTNTTNDTVQ